MLLHRERIHPFSLVFDFRRTCAGRIETRDCRERLCPVGRRTQPEVVFADAQAAAGTRSAMVLSTMVNLNGGVTR